MAKGDVGDGRFGLERVAGWRAGEGTLQWPRSPGGVAPTAPSDVGRGREGREETRVDLEHWVTRGQEAGLLQSGELVHVPHVLLEEHHIVTVLLGGHVDSQVASDVGLVVAELTAKGGLGLATGRLAGRSDRAARRHDPSDGRSLVAGRKDARRRSVGPGVRRASHAAGGGGGEGQGRRRGH